MRVPVWLRQTDNTCGTVVVAILGQGPGATFIPDAHRGTSIPALPVCWCPCGRPYWKCNDFSLRTLTGEGLIRGPGVFIGNTRRARDPKKLAGLPWLAWMPGLVWWAVALVCGLQRVTRAKVSF